MLTYKERREQGVQEPWHSFSIGLKDDLVATTEYAPLQQNMRQIEGQAIKSQKFLDETRTLMNLNELNFPHEVVAPAPIQEQQPKQAPPEQSWKDKQREKSEHNSLMRANKRITKHADEYTGLVAANQTTLREQQLEETPMVSLETLCRRARITITPDMYEGRAFADNQLLLADHLDALEKISQLLEDDPNDLMFNYVQKDPVEAGAVKRVVARKEEFERLYQTALTSHGIDELGHGIKHAGTVKEARQDIRGYIGRLNLNIFEEKEINKKYTEEYVDARMTASELQMDANEKTQSREGTQLAWIKEKMTEKSYEAVESLRSKIEEKSPDYLQHRGTIDDMFTTFIANHQALSRLDKRNRAFLAAADEIMQKDFKNKTDIHSVAISKSGEVVKAMNDLSTMSTNLESAIRALLGDHEMTKDDERVLGQYNYFTPAELELRELLTNGAASTVQVGPEDMPQLPYQETQEQMAPLANAVINADVEGMMAMSTEELATHTIEIAELLKSYMIVEKSKEIIHPIAPKYSIFHDIVGNKADDFTVRGAILKGLHEKARSSAAIELLRRNIDVEQYLRSDDGKQPPTDKEEQLKQLRERIKTSDDLLAISNAQRIDMHTYGTEAFAERVKQMCMVNSPLSTLIALQVGTKYPKATDIINGRGNDPEAPVIMQQLRNTTYRLAGWNEREATESKWLDEKGNPITSISEPMFRTIGSYLITKAGQTQTEEEFIRMMRNLSAGQGLEYGESFPDEIQAAREKNWEGLLEIKETMRLHYEYMSRKYGTSFDSLSVEFLADNYDDFSNDLAQEQAHLNFVTKIPGFIDHDNPADEDMYNQVCYFSKLGHQLKMMVSFAAMDTVSYEALKESIGERCTGGDMKLVKDYLIRNAERLGVNMTGNVNIGQQVGKRQVVQPREDDLDDRLYLSR